MNELSPGQILWPLLSIISSLSAIAVGIIAVIKLNRRIPPLPEEVAKIYATKIEVQDLSSHLNDRIDREMMLIGQCNAEQTRKIDALITTTNHSAQDTQRALGRIEGKLDAHLEAHS